MDPHDLVSRRGFSITFPRLIRDHPISWLADGPAPDRLQGALLEIDVAIAMVSVGAATSVQQACLQAVAGVDVLAAAREEAAGLTFRVRRPSPRSIVLAIGPHLRVGGNSLEGGP